MTDDLHHVCQFCREPVDPEAPETVAAWEMVRTEAMGPLVEYVEGMGVLFHEHCFPEGDPGYRRKPRSE